MSQSASPQSPPLGFLAQELARLEGEGLKRALTILGSGSSPWVRVNGREALLLCSNNYLGLASHPRVVAAAQEAAATWGYGAGASRLVSGTLELHSRLEEGLARFLGAEAALLFSSGYLANLGVIPSLAGPGDVIYSDQFNHASIVDGCRLSGAQVMVYPHADARALEALLAASEGRRRLIVTEGVFSMEGDIAPLSELVSLARRYDALLMVDDAHALGVLGPGGRGTPELLGMGGQIPILVGTLGKALGGLGAFVAGSHELRDYLLNKARSFIFTTALPPPVMGGALAALEVVREEPERRQTLLEKAEYLRRGLKALGFNILGAGTPIVPALVGSPTKTVLLSQLLLEEGVYVQAIRPPTVPEGECRLRCSVMATHSWEDLERALRAFAKAGRELGIIG
jgi:8-amino-7-oxononanoate synthase